MGPVSHKIRRFLIAALLGASIGGAGVSILVTEGALHIQVRPRPDPHDADAIAQDCVAAWEPARINAADGVLLDGWLFTPRQPNGSGVIVLHGVGDSRTGMAAHADFLLHAGFTVLLPDARGHGSSGGSAISYGIRESRDVHSWADWLLRKGPVSRLYGVGQSMGAAILLESLAREPRFRAMVADCPFDSFEDIAYYRLQRLSGLGRWAAWPVVQTGFLYTRLIYGFDLRRASPADAVRSTTVPILLIHGTADTNIPPEESVALHALNSRSTTLWLVPGANHVGSLGANPREYARRVTEWFRSHP
jgi:dipeptidyl aminopeptidase/acylaminoacyl peptidase